MAAWIICLVLPITFLIIHGDQLNDPADFDHRSGMDRIIRKNDLESQYNLKGYFNKIENSDYNSLDGESRRTQRFYFGSSVVEYKKPSCNSLDSYKKPLTGSCNKYYVCEKGTLQIYRCFFMFNFDPNTLSCKWFWKVQCKHSPPPSPTSTKPTPSTSSFSTSTQASTSNKLFSTESKATHFTSTSEGTPSISTAHTTVSASEATNTIVTSSEDATSTHTAATSTGDPKTTSSPPESATFISTVVAEND